MKHWRKSSFFVLMILFCGTSCVSLEAYEQVYINEPEMELGVDASGDFQNYVYKIRTGATPPAVGKASGGCGCN